MAKNVPAGVSVVDLLQMSQLMGSVTVLLNVLAGCGELPDAVMTAADCVRRDVAAFVGGDIEAPPAPSDEDRIRGAMAEAHDHPGRVITR